jgi:5-carboxymethyl-2-hydroxymuconate isomerase
MPHCIIEYSEDLDGNADAIIRSVHTGAAMSGLFELSDIKTRAISYKHYQVGVTQASFIHVSSRILAGRDNTQKGSLNAAIVDQLGALAFSNCSITAEVIDIHKDSYIKLETLKDSIVP